MLTNGGTSDTVYTQKRETMTGGKSRLSNGFRRELKKRELRFNCGSGAGRAGPVRAERAATQFDEAALLQRDSRGASQHPRPPCGCLCRPLRAAWSRLCRFVSSCSARAWCIAWSLSRARAACSCVMTSARLRPPSSKARSSSCWVWTRPSTENRRAAWKTACTPFSTRWIAA